MKGRLIPPYPAERIAAARATFEQHGDAMLAAAETLPRLVRLADGRKLRAVSPMSGGLGYLGSDGLKVVASYDATPHGLLLHISASYAICMMARSREALARGWIDMLIAHARPRQTKGWATIRAAILKRDRYTCTVCGQSSATGAALHVDHILPVKLSGDDHPDNLQTLCDQCNLARAARPFDEFITKT